MLTKHKNYGIKNKDENIIEIGIQTLVWKLKK